MPIINDEMFQNWVGGKRVALVGPAASAHQFKQGEKIDSNDIVCRVKSFYVIPEKRSFYGSRTDILYTISYLQFELKNFNESLTNLDILINNSLTEKMYVSVSKSDNSRQEILMRAQLHYLKGLIYSEQNNKDLAKISFEKSVEISSDFQNVIDKLNLL